MSVLVVNDTRVDRHHGCHAVVASIEALLVRNGLGPISYWPAHADWVGDARFDAALDAAHLVVINGEGTIHHDRPAGRRLLEAGMHARTLGVPVALINTGWEANSTEFVSMLENFNLLAARDSRSAAHMRVGGAKVRVVPDLSIWYARTHPPGPNKVNRIGIGFTDNVDRFKSLELERLRRACRGETLAIGYGEAGARGWVRFLRDGIGLRQDIRHPLRLARLGWLRHRYWRQTSSDTDSFLTRIAQLELLVSGRFHACTLALATDTPVVAQSSNTGKIAALFHDAGLEPWRSEQMLEPKTVVDARARGWSDAERTALNTYLAGSMTAAEELFADLTKLTA